VNRSKNASARLEIFNLIGATSPRCGDDAVRHSG
jgi:hypothetical protein